MIVFVAGMPRAGSMWTYNVTRAILEAKKISVLPKLIKVDERSIIQDALVSVENKNEVHCIKTHIKLESPIPTKHPVKIICNVRDVRDACLSYMRFMKADYEVGLQIMKIMMELTDYYISTFADNLITIRFEDVVNNPHPTIGKISDFLGVELSEIEKKEIIAKFDRSNIQKKLHELSSVKLNENGQVIDDEQKEFFDSVKKFDGTYSIFDKVTSFQSDHVTSITDGEWESYFDKNQKAMLNALSRKWLLKYGYKI